MWIYWREKKQRNENKENQTKLKENNVSVNHSTNGWDFAEKMQPNDKTNNANEHNIVKTPDWEELYQLAICNSSRGVEIASTEKQLQLSGPSGT